MDLVGIAILLGISLGAMGGIAAWTGIFWFGLAAFTATFLVLLYRGLEEVLPDPPHKGVGTLFRRRMKWLVDEGWHFFLFRSFVIGVIPVKVEKVNFDFSEQLVRTPDFAALEVPISITVTPGAPDREYRIEEGREEPEEVELSKSEKADALIRFLNSGGEEGVKTILTDIVRERLREWAINEIEGPKSWREALGAQEEAGGILLKAILGEALTPVLSRVPTSILLKYFSDPPRPPTESEKQGPWGGEPRDNDLWPKVTDQLNTEDRARVAKAVERRRNEIKKTREGDGHFRISHLGVILNRLNVGEIKLTGELARVAELPAKERQDWEAESLKLNILMQRVAQLSGVATPTFSPEQALEIVQTEHGKVRKEIREGKLSVSDGARKVIEAVAEQLLGRRVIP